ncbi:MAG: ABC transporter ATP-binding protein [Myxococcota bacterium]
MSDPLIWPSPRGPEALRRLYEVLDLDVGLLRPVDGADPPELWLREATERSDRVVDPVTVTHGMATPLAQRCGPCLVELAGHGLLVVLRGGHRRARVLATDGSIKSIPTHALVQRIRRPATAPLVPQVRALLGDEARASRRGERARSELLDILASERACGRVWLLRVSPYASLRDQLRAASVGRQAVAFGVVSVAHRALQSIGWAWIISTLLTDQLDWSSIGIWAALLMSSAVLATLAIRVGAGLSVELGALVRRRLMWGALQMNLDDGRSRGIGQLLGLVLEGTSMEMTAIQSALTVTLALVEAVALVVALLVTGYGLLSLVFGGCLLLMLLEGRRFYRARTTWTEQRLSMTHDFIEKLLGHRTRRTQGDPSGEAREERDALERYRRVSETADARCIPLGGIIAPAWATVAVALLIGSALLAAVTRAELALGVGLVLYGVSILRDGGARLAQLVDHVIGLRMVLPLWRAGSERPRLGLPGIRVDDEGPRSGPLLELRKIDFGYGTDTRLLDDVSMVVQPGERVLLVGASGSGKSTLVDLVAGLRRPHGGVLRLGGVDQDTLGPWRWRHRALAIHQFQTNHIFSESLAFNLLLGRGWPPTEDDLAAAEAVCQELGLASLLDRMPAGLMQRVGEGGWSLSHGEQTRVFLARALLQEPWIMVLDETLSALDPATLHQVAAALRRYPGAILAVAHP